MTKVKKKKTKKDAPAPDVVSTMSDKKWMAECDARTLAEAKAIQMDRKRVNAACKAAKKMVDEKMKEAKAMQAVAHKKKV